MCLICHVRIKPVKHHSHDTETPTKNFLHCFVIDHIERCAEIVQYKDRDLAGIDVAHALIVDCCDCSVSQVVGLIGRLL